MTITTLYPMFSSYLESFASQKSKDKKKKDEEKKDDDKKDDEKKGGDDKKGDDQKSSTTLIECNFDDGRYAWPNLYQEADEMLQAALAMYPFSALRQLAKIGALDIDNDSVLALPISARKVVELIGQHEDELTDNLGEEYMALIKGALQSMHERHEQAISETSSGFEVWFGSSSSKKTNDENMSQLLVFSDEKSMEELVYAIGIDRARKRISVAFRGSVTQQDFATDACIAMKRIKNPFADLPDQSDRLKIHSGFFAYLLEAADGKTSKLQEIVDHLVKLFEQNPTYRLYVTGHSLGGALAALFAFSVSTSPETAIPKPITCVSVASPKVGNESWRKAFQVAEEQGKIRHLRIANANDPITLGPPASTKKTLTYFSPAAHLASLITKADIMDEIYKHVGVKLKLISEGEKIKYGFNYAQGHWKQDMLRPSAFASVTEHFGNVYSHRLLLLKDDLEKYTLNELYRRRDSLREMGKE